MTGPPDRATLLSHISGALVEDVACLGYQNSRGNEDGGR